MAATAHGTLTANEVHALDLDAGLKGFVIVNRSLEGEIWVRLDGEDPAPYAAGSYVVMGARDFPVRRRSNAADVTYTIKLVSDADREFSVEAVG